MASPCIPAHADVSGISVRITVYAHCALAIAQLLLSLVEEHRAPYGERVYKRACRSLGTLMLTGAALLGAVYYRYTTGSAAAQLSAFDAVVSLYLGWCISLSVLGAIFLLRLPSSTSSSGPTSKSETSIPEWFILVPSFFSTIHIVCLGALGIWLANSAPPLPECTVTDVDIVLAFVFGRHRLRDAITGTAGWFTFASNLALIPILNAIAVLTLEIVFFNILKTVTRPFVKLACQWEKTLWHATLLVPPVYVALCAEMSVASTAVDAVPLAAETWSPSITPASIVLFLVVPLHGLCRSVLDLYGM